jgi:hypothetical protein
MPDHPSTATEDDRVVSIRTRRKFQPVAGHQEPVAASGGLGRYEQGGEPDDFRHRMAVNALAFLFVIGLVFAGVWLADTIATMRKMQDCVLSGKRGCTPVEMPTRSR